MTVGALVLLPFGAHGAWQIAGRPYPMLTALGTAVLASVVPYTLELAALRRAQRRPRPPSSAFIQQACRRSGSTTAVVGPP